MAQQIGRPVPKKLEQEVVEKFKRFDTKYAEEKKKKFPHLVKGLPGPNDPGKGSVIWVGLNADPCAAKFKAKQGLTSHAPSGTASMPNLPTSSGFGLSDATMKRRRNLAQISSIAHFLDQSKRLCEPAWISGPRPMPGPLVTEETDDPQELLYSGVTQQEEGRYGYLKMRKTLFPQEKAETPVTCFQEVGWSVYMGKSGDKTLFANRQNRPIPPKPTTIIIS